MKPDHSKFLLLPLLLTILFFTSCETATKEELTYPTITKSISDSTARAMDKLVQEAVSPTFYPGFKLQLWASDSLLFDPIALDVTDEGNVLITTTRRSTRSEFDIRGHVDWMTDAISFETVEDRRSFLLKEYPIEKGDSPRKGLRDHNQDGAIDYRDLETLKESIHMIKDLSGDGLADHAQLMIEDFNEVETDVANGLMEFDGSYYLTVAPDMWRLEDHNKDGVIDEKTALSSGYLVHIGFGGHGLSGLTVGPEGKIYWANGDIGLDVTDQTGRNWKFPNQGAIMRCNPDGSDFEVFAQGLRNTHEIMFDEYGNLFSVDNDGDHPGEKERMMYISHGSDAGWRINWQFGKYTDSVNNNYKVWMDEKYFMPHYEGQAAHIVPPILNYHAGPSGMVYNPGTALGERWKNYFFMTEFTGNAATSNIYAFKVKPDGANFAFDGEEKITEGLLSVGIDFGPDGALYAADWITGWNTKGFGRIWKLDFEDENQKAKVLTKSLIQADYDEMSKENLQEMMAYEDMRVRQKAQFELAKRGDEGMTTFVQTLASHKSQLARIHSIFGIRQMAGMDASKAENLIPYLNDEDDEIKAQAAKWLGDIRNVAAWNQLEKLVNHKNSRVGFFATEALGRIGDRDWDSGNKIKDDQRNSATKAIWKMITTNNGADMQLRHVGALALSRVSNAQDISTYHDHQNPVLRSAAVVSLRRLASAKLSLFLGDSDKHIANDVARAINDDWSVAEALPALADALLDTRFPREEPFIRRAINANLRVGESKNIDNLLNYLLLPDQPEVLRVEALATLKSWGNPSVLDRVDGRNRKLQPLDISAIPEKLASVSEQLLATKHDPTLASAIGTLSQYKVDSTIPQIRAAMKRGGEVAKVAGLNALDHLQAENLTDDLQSALTDKSAMVRSTAFSLIARGNFTAADLAKVSITAMPKATLTEQQNILNELALKQGPAVLAALATFVQNVKDKTLSEDILYELSQAISAQGDEALSASYESYKKEVSSSDWEAEHLESLSGGDKALGRDIMVNHPAAQCMKCHAIGSWGANVGPNLKEVSKRLSNLELLESLVNPSAEIALGYGAATVKKTDGEMVVGLLIADEPDYVELQLRDEVKVKIMNSDIAERKEGMSSMPPMSGILNKKELRDLVKYLGEL